MRLSHRAALVLAAAAAVLAAWSAPAPDGKDLFERRCSGCHALDRHKEGPRLRGVYGRKAAALSDFEYSDALKATGITWDDTTLDRWLTDPDAVAPGTDMAFRVADARERSVLIAYLKSMSR